MRILILTLGSRGDVQPFVALGAALRDVGHAVTLSTGRGFDDLIVAHGLISARLSVDFREMIRSPEMQRALSSVVARVKVFRGSKDLVRRLLDEMWAVSRDVRPDLIVYHPKCSGAASVAEALKVVAAPAFLQPGFVATGAFPTPFLPVANLGRMGNRMSHSSLLWLMSSMFSSVMQKWRRETLGLDGAGRRDMLGGYAATGGGPVRLHGYSRHLVPTADSWGEPERITGYWFLPEDKDWEPPQRLARFLAAGPPPIYFGFGSMPGDAERQTRAVLDALVLTGQRGVLATGWGGLDSVVDGDRVCVLDAVPHDWLFPRCAAVVHHGGAGTTHEALRWGRPSIVCPVFGDQPFGGAAFTLSAPGRHPCR